VSGSGASFSSSTGPQVVGHEGLQERRLADTGLADDVDVAEAVTLADAKALPLAAKVGLGKEGDLVVAVGGRHGLTPTLAP
jgi:hypothetical protein